VHEKTASSPQPMIISATPSVSH